MQINCTNKNCIRGGLEFGTLYKPSHNNQVNSDASRLRRYLNLMSCSRLFDL